MGFPIYTLMGSPCSSSSASLATTTSRRPLNPTAPEFIPSSSPTTSFSSPSLSTSTSTSTSRPLNPKAAIFVPTSSKVARRQWGTFEEMAKDICPPGVKVLTAARTYQTVAETTTTQSEVRNKKFDEMVARLEKSFPKEKIFAPQTYEVGKTRIVLPAVVAVLRN